MEFIILSYTVVGLLGMISAAYRLSYLDKNEEKLNDSLARQELVKEKHQVFLSHLVFFIISPLTFMGGVILLICSIPLSIAYFFINRLRCLFNKFDITIKKVGNVA